MAHPSSPPPTTADGRLAARPGAPSRPITAGLHRLGLDGARDALLYVPNGYTPGRPLPLVVSCHGAGGDERSGLYPLQDLADEFRFVLLSPASRGRTWDVVLGGFGPDVAFIDQALRATFDRCAIDPQRLAISGFSDGASYALSLGLTNGAVFTHVLAFSPGFLAPGPLEGRPPIFVSHGVADTVLSISHCSRRLVPHLRDAGYDVTYDEFDGPHTVPPEIARAGITWFLSPAG